MSKIMRILVFYLLFCLSSTIYGAAAGESKVLICGICKDIGRAVPNTILNVEKLGSSFQDYRVIIYENNSKDKTAYKLQKWAANNLKIHVVSENLPEDQLPIARTERIARARNIVLEIAKQPQYADYKYLIMADLDFMQEWPIDAVVEVIESKRDWDCVAAHGVLPSGLYWDRYAFRDKDYPLGPELMGSTWWDDLGRTWFALEADDWKRVYSAFGGLAIYKTAVITKFAYSGSVTKDLKCFYRKILHATDPQNYWVQKYLTLIGRDPWIPREQIPVIFKRNSNWNQPRDYDKVTCCEHVPLFASMVIHGYDKIYINPKMYMFYFEEPNGG